MKTDIPTTSGRIQAYREGAVGWLVFNNPERRNAVSIDMWAAIPEVLEVFSADPDIRAVVLTGAGDKAFVSGADISQFDSHRASTDAVAEYDKIAMQANRSLDGIGKPVIAAIRGYCIGAGVGLALKSDLRICTEDARFAIPAARLGLGYRLNGIIDLVAAVGAARAKEIFFTARQFSAQEALAMGLVDHVVPAERLADALADHTGRIAENAPLTMRAAKMAINAVAKAGIGREQAAAIEAAVADCFASEDYREGRQAFAGKRKPVFTGK
jgi:enoyl-CoA hydratase/carnithine racemase